MPILTSAYENPTGPAVLKSRFCEDFAESSALAGRGPEKTSAAAATATSEDETSRRESMCIAVVILAVESGRLLEPRRVDAGATTNPTAELQLSSKVARTTVFIGRALAPKWAVKN